MRIANDWGFLSDPYNSHVVRVEGMITYLDRGIISTHMRDDCGEVFRYVCDDIRDTFVDQETPGYTMLLRPDGPHQRWRRDALDKEIITNRQITMPNKKGWLTMHDQIYGKRLDRLPDIRSLSYALSLITDTVEHLRPYTPYSGITVIPRLFACHPPDHWLDDTFDYDRHRYLDLHAILSDPGLMDGKEKSVWKAIAYVCRIFPAYLRTISVSCDLETLIVLRSRIVNLMTCIYLRMMLAILRDDYVHFERNFAHQVVVAQLSAFVECIRHR